MWHWEEGRQQSGYYKMCLARGKFWDLYILKYAKGAYIKRHFDYVPDGYEHHRINFTLLRAEQGGTFFKMVKGKKIYFSSRFANFRPDIEIHGVSKIAKGARYVLSIGWIKTGWH